MAAHVWPGYWPKGRIGHPCGAGILYPRLTGTPSSSDPICRLGTLSAWNPQEPPADGAARFDELVAVIARAQGAGLIGAKRESGEQGQVVLLLREDESSGQDVIARIRALLGLTAGVWAPRIVYGTGPGAPNEIAVQTRSMMEVLATLGSRILVPESDVAAGRTPDTAVDPAGVAPVAQVRIHSSNLPLRNAFASVRYQDHWFWIDENDYPSKRAFSFLLLLLALVARAGDQQQAPLLTIPTG
jgi:hypothetical protein